MNRRYYYTGMVEKVMKKGIVYWITGLAGSGKTTIGNALYYKLRKYSTVVLLDGDILKNIINGGV